MPEPPTREVFAARIGQQFRISDSPVDLELIEATELSHQPHPPSERRGFSLLFQGPPGASLPQGTYALEHNELGEMAMFLVPMQPTEAGPVLEAIFN